MNTDEFGRIVLGTEEAPVTTFALNRGGRLEAMLRADTVSAWETAAQSRNLLVEKTLEDESVVLVPGEGITIDGPMYITTTPATFDEDGNELTAAVQDPRPHYNIIIEGVALETRNADDTMPRWEETLLMWMNLGTQIDAPEQNNAEDGMKLSDVTVIDPTTVQQRDRVFL